MAGYDFTTVVKVDEAIRRLKLVSPEGLRPGMRAAANAISALLTRKVVVKKLLGQVLKRQTGTLIRSITANRFVEDTPAGIATGIGTNLGYGIAHEVGFKGTVQRPTSTVRAHTRKTRRGTQKVRAHERRAHTAKLVLRARRYLRSTVTEQKPNADAIALKALQILASGRVPTVAELGRN